MATSPKATTATKRKTVTGTAKEGASRLDASNLEMPSVEMSKAPFKAVPAKCVQCGKELRAIPFALNNIVCKNCDGADRSRRMAMPVIPEKLTETVALEEETVSSE